MTLGGLYRKGYHDGGRAGMMLVVRTALGEGGMVWGVAMSCDELR